MKRFGVAIFSVLAFSGVSLAVEVEEAAEKLVEAQGKLKSFSAALKSKHMVSKSMNYVSEGHLDWKRDGDKILFNQEVHRTGTHDFEGEKMIVKEHRSTVCDGKNVYMINHENGNVIRQNYNPESFETLDVGVILDSLWARHSELKVLDDEKVGGRDCFKLEGTDDWNDDEGSEDDPMINITRHVYWFDKETGMLIKMAGYDKKGTEAQVREYSNVKINPDIKEDRFAYKAPANVNLVDHTQDD